MFGLRLINALFIAINADKQGFPNYHLNTTACLEIFANYFEHNVQKSGGELVFRRDNYTNKASDTCLCIYDISRMKEIDPAAVPGGFFVDYNWVDGFHPATLNHVKHTEYDIYNSITKHTFRRFDYFITVAVLYVGARYFLKTA